MFWINVYIWRENDTGGGTFNPEGDEFAGYPDQDSSPYLLPWTGGDTIVCSQGNQGLFSHNNVSAGREQIYAYDFHLDQGDRVRAARAGTVVDYFDSVPNNTEDETAADFTTVSGQTTSDSKNFIVIRHDTANAVPRKPQKIPLTVPANSQYLHHTVTRNSSTLSLSENGSP
jgi:hypothetical protein